MTKQLEQGSQEWLKERVGRITGSRVGAILGVNPYSSREDVMREMVREYFCAEREFTGNAATEHGNEYEAVALQDYELLKGVSVDKVGLIVHPKYDWIAVSPDGLVGTRGGVEIKCPYSGKIKPLEETQHYLAQVLLSLVVTDRDWWDFYVWTESGENLEAVTNTEAKVWFAGNFDKLKAFHEQYLEIIADEKLAKPYLADLETDASKDEDWQSLAEQYAEAKSESDAWTKRASEIKQKLIERAESFGTKKVRGCGVQVYKATRKGSVQYGKIPELKGVDLDKYRKKDSEYWTVKDG